MVSPLELLVALVLAVGLVGVVLPVLPGLLLVWAGVLLWASEEGTALGWGVLAAATAVLLGSQVVKYLVPGRRLRSAGVPTRTLLAGAVLGVVGFFAVPVVGLLLGFVLGVWLAELTHLRSARPAWASTVHAIKAVVLSTAIELSAGFVVVAGWAVAALATP